MSSAVDKRIVEMQFDNQQFERGVSTTLNSLDRLKAALEFKDTGRGLSTLERSLNGINLDGIASSVSHIEERFSAMGIVAKRIIENITDAAFGMLKKITAGTIGQIYSGGVQRALNLEQAQFQLEGLGASWDDFKDDILYGVQDTAYGLDEAAIVASQLVASGMEAGEGMRHVLRGISGVAAMTNASYSEIGHLFTTISSNGKLMTMQMRQLAYRGLNVAAILAKALGKTEAEINEMVTRGEISFETFSNAMYDAFGEHAARANETFTGSLSNVKAALSRIGADVATAALKGLRDIFNALRVVIDETHTSLQPFITLLSTAATSISEVVVQLINNQMTMTIINSLINLFSTLGNVLVSVGSAFGTAFASMAFAEAPVNNMYQYMVRIQVAIRDTIEWITNFIDSIKFSSDELSNVTRTLRGVFAIFDIGIQTIRAIAQVLLSFTNEVVDVRATTLANLGDMGDYFVHLRDTIVPHIYEIRDKLIEWKNSIDWNSIFLSIDQAIQWFRTTLSNTRNALQPLIDDFVTGFNFLKDNIDWNGIFNTLIDKFTHFKDTLAPILQWITDKLTNLGPTIRALGSGIRDALAWVGGILVDLFTGESSEGLDNPITSMAREIEETNVEEKIRVASKAIVDGSNSVTEAITEVRETVDDVKDGAVELKGNVEALGGKVRGFVGDVTTAIPGLETFSNLLHGNNRNGESTGDKSFLEKAFDTAKQIASYAGRFLSTALNIHSLMDVLEYVKEFIEIALGFKLMSALGGIGKLTESLVTLSTTSAQAIPMMTQHLTSGRVSLLNFFGTTNQITNNGSQLNPIANGLNTFLESLSNTVNGLNTNGFIGGLRNIAVTLLVLAGALFVLSKVDSDSLIASVAGLSMVMAAMGAVLKDLSNSLGVGPTSTQKAVDANLVIMSFIPLATSMLILAAAIKLMGSINIMQMVTAISGMGSMILVFMTVIKQLASLSESDVADALIGVVAINMLAGDLLVIGLALRLVSGMQWETLTVGFVSLIGTIAMLTIIIKALAEGINKDNIAEAITGVLLLNLLANDLIIIGVALRIVNNMDWESLAVGLIAMDGTLLALAGIVILLSKTLTEGDIASAVAGAVAIDALSLSLIVIGASLKIVSTIPWDSMIMAWASLSALFAELLIAALAMGKCITTTDIPGLAIGILSIVALSMSLKKIAKAIAVLAGYDWDVLIASVAAISILFVALVGMTLLLSKSELTSDIKKAVKTIAVMLSIMGATLALAQACKTIADAFMELAGYSWDQLWPALASIGAMLAGIAVIAGIFAAIGPAALAAVAGAAAIYIMSVSVVNIADALKTVQTLNGAKISNTLTLLSTGIKNISAAMLKATLGVVGAVAMSIMTDALKELIPIIIELGDVDFETSTEGIDNLSAVIIKMGDALKAMTPALLLIAAFGGVLLVVSAGLSATTVAILAFTVAMNLLVNTVNNKIGLISLMLTNLKNIINQVISDVFDLIVHNHTKITTAIITIVQDSMRVVVETWPSIKEAISTMLTGLIDIVIENVPKFAELAGVILENALTMVVTYTPRIVETVVNLALALLNVLAQKVPEFATKGIEIMLGLLAGIAEKIDDVVDKGVDVAVSFLEGIGRNAQKIADAGFNLVIDLINGVANSVRENHERFYDAIANLISAGMEALADLAARGFEKGAEFISGLIAGIQSKQDELVGTLLDIGTRGMIGTIADAIDSNSPSKEAAKLGAYFDEGLIKGLNDEAYAVEAASSNLGNTMVDSMSEALQGLSDRIQNGIDTEPVIRPVLDLSDVESGSARLTSIFSSGKSINVGSALSRMQNLGLAEIAGGVSGGTSVVFNQYNTSPKALSRKEIYLQTENQLDEIKDKLK